MRGAKEIYGALCSIGSFDCDRVVCRVFGLSEPRAKASDVFSMSCHTIGVAGRGREIRFQDVA